MKRPTPAPPPAAARSSAERSPEADAAPAEASESVSESRADSDPEARARAASGQSGGVLAEIPATEEEKRCRSDCELADEAANESFPASDPPASHLID